MTNSLADKLESRGHWARMLGPAAC
jgi:hypothetical protein